MVAPRILKRIKKILLEKQESLENELSAFAQKNIHNREDYTAKFPDYGDKDDENVAEVATFSDRLSLEKTLEKTLQDVKAALVRLEKGSYGVCKYCGKEINEQRLLARPASSACIECKENFKKR